MRAERSLFHPPADPLTMDTTDALLFAVVLSLFGIAAFLGDYEVVGWYGAFAGLGLGTLAMFFAVEGDS